MKKIIIGIVTLSALTFCHYAPAQTTISLPDGQTLTCVQNGTVVNCY
jgi:hypothetical protein